LSERATARRRSRGKLLRYRRLRGEGVEQMAQRSAAPSICTRTVKTPRDELGVSSIPSLNTQTLNEWSNTQQSAAEFRPQKSRAHYWSGRETTLRIAGLAVRWGLQQEASLKPSALRPAKHEKTPLNGARGGGAHLPAAAEARAGSMLGPAAATAPSIPRRGRVVPAEWLVYSSSGNCSEER
jgi:hypothetical protein